MQRFFTFISEVIHYFQHGVYVSAFTGVLPDERTDEEKDTDYLHEERTAATAPVTDPFSNAKIFISPWQLENQNQVGACVYHGLTLALGIEFKKTVGYFVRLSKMFGYRLRPGYPIPGSSIPAAAQNLKGVGAPLYTTLPNVYSEAEASAINLTPQIFNEAGIYKGLEYYFIKGCNDIAQLAAVAQNGHGVPICIYSSIREWAQAYPSLMDNVQPDTAAVNHEICILPNSGFVENGKRYVVIQDSALFAGLNLRYVSEDFIRARCLSALYFDRVTMKPGTGPKPVHTFTTALTLGQNSPEVKALQTMLIYEGLLPADCNTGLFGGRTLAAVKAFQYKYAADILVPAGIDVPTGFFGALSIAKANSIYAQA